MFKTKLIPRANPMIIETPTRLAEPLVKASTTRFSPRPFLPKQFKKMMIMAIVKNEAAMFGKPHPFAITPQIIIGKATANRVKVIFFFQSKAGETASLSIDHIASKAS